MNMQTSGFKKHARTVAVFLVLSLFVNCHAVVNNEEKEQETPDLEAPRAPVDTEAADTTTVSGTPIPNPEADDGGAGADDEPERKYCCGCCGKLGEDWVTVDEYGQVQVYDMRPDTEERFPCSPCGLWNWAKANKEHAGLMCCLSTSVVICVGCCIAKMPEAWAGEAPTEVDTFEVDGVDVNIPTDHNSVQDGEKAKDLLLTNIINLSLMGGFVNDDTNLEASGKVSPNVKTTLDLSDPPAPVRPVVLDRLDLKNIEDEYKANGAVHPRASAIPMNQRPEAERLVDGEQNGAAVGN